MELWANEDDFHPKTRTRNVVDHKNTESDSFLNRPRPHDPAHKEDGILEGRAYVHHDTERDTTHRAPA